MKEKKKIQSIERMNEILTYLSEKPRGERLSTISRELMLNKSTAFGIISTLEQMGYLGQDQDTGRYYLDLKLFELGQAAYARLDLASVAKPFVTNLSKKCGETVHIAVLSDTEVVYLDKVEGSKAMRVSSQIGGRQPVYCTALGKALLANSSDEVINETIPKIEFEKLTDTTITGVANFKKELENIKQQGYAIDNQESEMGLYCIAAPIFSGEGKTIAALSVAGMISRIRDEGGQELVDAVVNTAAEISRGLGYR